MTLEERVKRIICESEVELEGEAYVGKYELGNMKSMTNFIVSKLRNKEGYRNRSTGDKIMLSKRSAEKPTEPVAVKVYNLQGRLIASEQASTRFATVKLNTGSGIYLFKAGNRNAVKVFSQNFP